MKKSDDFKLDEKKLTAQIPDSYDCCWDPSGDFCCDDSTCCC